MQTAKTLITGHTLSLIRAFAVHSIGSWKPKLSSCGQRNLWSAQAYAQAELSLRWAHMLFCWFSFNLIRNFLAFDVCIWQKTKGADHVFCRCRINWRNPNILMPRINGRLHVTYKHVCTQRSVDAAEVYWHESETHIINGVRTVAVGLKNKIFSDILSNLNSSNIGGSFTMANSNSFLSLYEILPTAKKKTVEIFLFYHEFECCVYS